MPGIRIVLVGPKFEGNVGAIARSMSNFDLDELYLVHPCELGEDAYRRSKHGNRILDNAKICDTIDEALEDCFFVAGTSGATTKGDTNFGRVPVSPRKFSEDIKGYDEKVAIMFGREDIGLYQDELDRCDVLISVPSGDENPILNLSHAATIVMYELFGTDHTTHPEPADHHEKELLGEFFDELLVAIDYNEDRRERTSVMFRRLMGRSIPTKCEYHTIMGVLGKAAKDLKSAKRRK